MPKITITRSFSKTKQVASIEPVNSFCSVSVEYENQKSLPDDMFITSVSEHLDVLVRQKVERTIKAEMKKVRREEQ